MALFAVVTKSNIWGGLILIATVIASFRRINFSNLKWYGLVICIIFLLQYISALANLSELNSPSVFPSPFNDRGIDRPLRVPIYREFGGPITEKIEKGPEQGMVRPTRWAYYLGYIISEQRVALMWLDWIVIILVSYYFVYFYSVTYERNMNLNTSEAIQRNLTRIEDEAEESVKISMRGSRKGSEILNNSIQDEDENHIRESSFSKRKTLNFNQANDYVEKIKKNMFLCKFYNGVSTFICATSTIFSLVLLLMIAFQIQGLINLIYICF